MTRLIKKFLIVNKIDEDTLFTLIRENDEFRTFTELYDIFWDLIDWEATTNEHSFTEK